MALQVNWADRYKNPGAYEAAVRSQLVNNNTPAIQQQLSRTPASPQAQQVAKQQNVQINAQRLIAPAQVNQQAPNVWETIGSMLGADAFKRTGEGIAEIVYELNGQAQKDRDRKAQEDEEDLKLIRHYGSLIKNGNDDTKARARTALASLMKRSNESTADFQARQQQIIDRTDPVKGAGALAEIGLNVATAGVGGAAAKGAVNTGQFLTKQLAKEAAIGAATGAGSGIASAYEANGAAANDDPNTFNSGVIGAAVGGAIPVIGKAGGKFINSVINKPTPEVKVAEKQIVDAIVPEVKALPKPKVTTRKPVESELTKPSVRLKRGNRGEIDSKLSNIDETDVFENRSIIKRLRNDTGKHFTEDSNQMFRLLGRIEKETGRKGLVDQYYYDTGRIRVANAIADSRVSGNEDIHKLFKGLKDFTKVGRFVRKLAGQDGKSQLDRFDDYAAARAELQNYKGMKTSKSREELAGLVVNGHKEFGERFTAMNNFYKDQAKYLYENGIISKSKMKSYQKNDDYIRIQRDVEDLVNQTHPGSKAVSLGSTSTKQRRKGSSREVLSPTRTLLERAQQMELEVQRNKAANNTIDVLGDYGLARRVSNSDGKNTVSRFRGGKKEFWEVPGDIKREMENLNPYIIGPVMQIIGAPNRLIRAGATGLNVPFAAANYIRDQVGSAIQSKNALVTHNPFVIIKSLGSAARELGDGSKDPIWKKFEEFTGNQTVYDELRNQKATNQTLRELRTGQKGRFINRAISPIRSVEDLIGVTEKATRFQNFKGTYIDILKKTNGDEAEALKQATLAARKNTTDFNRAGDWGRVINGFIPYFNAMIQGTRTMARSFKERPVATSIKTVSAVALPSVAATLWNYADPTRAEAYESISEFEKKDNFIIVGPDARQRSDGTWEGIIKIPKPPGYRDLTDPVRDVTEMFVKGEDNVNVANMLGDVLGAISGPIQTGGAEQFIGGLIPQQVKPFIQAATNRNFYTGRDIVPEYINKATDAEGNPVANSDKAYKTTSGTARELGKLFGVSPIIVENFVRDAAASVGQYGINAADQVSAAAGRIPQDQIGGKSIVEDVTGRFMEAKGDLLERNKTEGQKYFENRAKVTEKFTVNERAAYDALHPQGKNFMGDKIYEDNSIYKAAARLDAYSRFPKVFEADKALDAKQREAGSPGNPLYDLTGNNLKKVLEKESLPPGAKDPELSNLYKEDWYSEYSNKKSKFYDYLADEAKKDGKEFGGKDNPYPKTAPELQAAMDQYNSLAKGTGERSNFIKSNPEIWAAMTSQWAAVDNWQNKQREKRGLAATEGEEGKANGFNTSTSSSTYSSRGGGGSGGSRGSGINPYAYELKRGGATIKLSSSAKGKKPVAYKSVKKKSSKPKVSLKKATA